MSRVTKEEAREQAKLCWRTHAALRCHPKHHVHAPLMEITARAWDRIAERQEQAEKGGSDDAA